MTSDICHDPLAELSAQGALRSAVDRDNMFVKIRQLLATDLHARAGPGPGHFLPG